MNELDILRKQTTIFVKAYHNAKHDPSEFGVLQFLLIGKGVLVRKLVIDDQIHFIAIILVKKNPLSVQMLHHFDHIIMINSHKTFSVIKSRTMSYSPSEQINLDEIESELGLLYLE